MQFEFATAGRILFGPGKVREVPAAVKGFGSRVLLVRGRTGERSVGLVRELGGCVEFAVEGEPTVELARRGAEVARTGRCDVVIGFGGGSAIDAGKAIAALAGNPGDVLEYLEVVGQGKPLPKPSLPYIAIPTTAGTGSEVTRNAVLGSPEHKVKASLRSPSMLPALAVVDPELTLHLPPETTASTGLDALTQLIEPLVSVRANPVTELFCREGMKHVRQSLVRAYEEGGDIDARTGMSLASLFGGLALANSGLGVVHGFAAPIGGMFPAPHGAVCAALLPWGMEANILALRDRDPEGKALMRYREAAALLTGNEDAQALDGVECIREVVRRFNIPRLRAHGITDSDIPALVERAAKASSMKANPIVLTTRELTAVLQSAL
jgi:alcohol dehydrogenase class IV